MSVRLALAACAWCAAAAFAADIRPHAGMLRNPDISDSQIVFVYANDLWLAPRDGGVATPLASPPGQEMFPRFSPDGDTIAFVGNYDGNRDLYTVPVAGGTPFRVTHHPTGETLCDWAGDDALVFFAGGMGEYPRTAELYRVSAGGGMPEKLPVPYGANATVSRDGKWLAYTPHSRDHRTWKRYRGGMATDIWLFNLQTFESRKITDWEGTDTQPMWHGSTVYYLSDGGPEHRLNIWSFDTNSSLRRQITHHADFDAKWPAIGPESDARCAIIYQLGPSLRVLDLASGDSRPIDVAIPGDRPTLKAHTVDASQWRSNVDISSTGKRLVAEARGDIWTVPAKNGSPRNLTATSGVAERDPAWSPDGHWVAYFSDASGEYELYITPSDGSGEARRLTQDGSAFRMNPRWSPDSKRILFADKAGVMWLHTVDDDKTTLVDKDPFGQAGHASFSHDSRYVAYIRSGDNQQGAIWLYDIENDERSQLTSGVFADTWPTFDRKGDYLFFASNRDFTSPRYEDVGTTFIYDNTDRLFVVPLRADMASPFAPKSDEEDWSKDDKSDDEKADAKGDDAKDSDSKAESDKATSDDADEKAEASDDSDEKKDEKDDAEKEPLKIDIEGFERRAIPIPIPRGSFTQLCVNKDGQLIYCRHGDNASVKLFDLKDDKREEKTVVDGAGRVAISADGAKLMVSDGGRFAIVDAAAGQNMNEPVTMTGLLTTIDPRAEWAQILRDAWRVQRDFFYDPHMHGVDWNAVYKQYSAMAQDCVSREDLSFVIREMISELNVGHAYYWGGDEQSEPQMPVGMLGCDYALEDGAWRIKKIYEGASWDFDARGPLSQPGVDVKVGDYVLAVNGRPVDAGSDPWAAFVGLADRAVSLTVSDKPQIDDNARRVVVQTLSSESGLRFRSWIEANRKRVDELSDGRVGYIYVPDTGINGQNELFRQFYGQRNKPALIIDERWNGGGQLPDRFV
ncbi:MAG: PDZ domain-containing protein, partial [Phycisphaerales bacterium]|nr:PDZ domain-containing protein [Phycisphaerales bacterium]